MSLHLKKGVSLAQLQETSALISLCLHNFSECETFKGKKGGLTLWQS